MTAGPRKGRNLRAEPSSKSFPWHADQARQIKPRTTPTYRSLGRVFQRFLLFGRKTQKHTEITINPKERKANIALIFIVAFRVVQFKEALAH